MEALNKTDPTIPLIRWASIIVIIGGMKLSSEILTPFLLALFISIVASQPVNWLHSKGIAKSVAIVIVMIMIIGFGVLMGGLIGGSIAQFTQNLPKLDRDFQKSIIQLISSLNDMGINISSEKLIKAIDPSKIMVFTASTINGMGNMLGQTFIIVFIALFMLFEMDSFPAKFHIITDGSKNPRKYNFALIIHNVRNYLGIKTLTSLATGFIIAFGLKLIGVQFAFFWGLIAFLMNYIPNIGSILAAIPVLLFALVEHGLPGMLWTAGIYLAVNTIVGNILEPKIMGEGLGLSTLVVLLSLIFWGWVFGPIGMFLSVPFTMALKIILETSSSSKWLSVLLDSESHALKRWDEINNKKSKTE